MIPLTRLTVELDTDGISNIYFVNKSAVVKNRTAATTPTNNIRVSVTSLKEWNRCIYF